MDHTSIVKLIEDLEQADPADAAELADSLADKLAHMLDPEREGSG